MTSTAEPKKKLDIFRVLGAADGKNTAFYQTLTDDERKELQPFLVMRWMSGTSSASQVYMINELVNPYAFSLTQHKELLWKLMTVANDGRRTRYVWNKLPSRPDAGKSTAVKVVKAYFKYNTADAIAALNLLSKDEVTAMAEEMGWQSDDVSKVKREIKADHDVKRSASFLIF